MKSTTFPNSTTTTTTQSSAPTKSKEHILIQSSGAMIAVIVIGIITILTVVLIILKTYHRCTKTSRMLGRGPKTAKSSAAERANMPLGPRGLNSVSSGVAHAHRTMTNGFRLPRAELPSHDQNSMEQLSTISESTVVTIHSAPSLEDT